ncbi:MAG TPA: magnesium/cobalt transporter CorA [Fimbriimonas sp.]
MIHAEFHAGAACHYDDRQECDWIDLEDAIARIRDRRDTVWLNVYGNDDARVRELLEDRLGYHELAVEDALSDQERPTLQEYDEVLFFVIPVIVAHNGEDVVRELAFFLTGHSLVTYCRERVELVSTWFERWLQRSRAASDGSARLAYTLVDAAVDAYFPVADEIEDKVDSVADAIFSGDVEQVVQIQRLKRRLLFLRRCLAPTREVLNAMLRRDISQIPVTIEPYLQDILDHILRLGEMVDMNRETLASLLDVHLSTVSNNINYVMKRMTFYATALMTSTLIAGIYGMNFKHMPELGWAFGYPFALALMVASFVGVWFAFRRRGWI